MNSHLLGLFGSVLVAIVCGGLVGVEREWRRKPAGLRTNLLIAIGSALFTHASVSFGDSGRIAAQIVTGVGFIGAGAIMRVGSDAIHGLTTAATVWVVASLGMLAGMGRYGAAIGGTLLALAVLEVVGRVEVWIAWQFEDHRVRILARRRPGLQNDARRQATACRVELNDLSVEESEPDLAQLTVHFRAPASRSQLLLDRWATMDEVERVEDRLL